MFQNIFILLRWKDWAKNLIIFFPYIFNENIKGFDYLFDLFLVFVSFSILCSIVYIINDLKDLESDKLHSLKKKLKPLANGTFSVNFAKIILFILVTFLTFLIFINNLFYVHFLGYFLLMILYIFIIKQVIILDVLLLSLGYLIRLDIGSSVINVDSSINLLLCVFTLVLFVLFIKRYSEFLSQNNVRKSLNFYSSFLLNFLIISSAIFFILFSIYFIYYEKVILIMTLPFLIYNLVRYYNISIKKKLGEFPIEVVIKDKILLTNTFLILLIILILYF